MGSKGLSERLHYRYQWILKERSFANSGSIGHGVQRQHKHADEKNLMGLVFFFSRFFPAKNVFNNNAKNERNQ